ncbi:LOW QUALITY PROTEIN: hypothetical protein HID58_013913, partial [Brassica napus]
RARQWPYGTWTIVRSLMVWMLLLSGRTLTLPLGNRGLRVESISPFLVIFARLRPQKTFPAPESRSFTATGNDYGSNFLLITGDISKRCGFVSAMSLGEEDPVIFHTTVRNKEEEDYSDCKDRYVAAKTAVFWDMDGCEIPQGGNADLISRNIKSAIVNDGFGDTVTIYAYGYMNPWPRYFPAVGDRKEKLEMILVDALCCAVDNPDTTNLMFVVAAFALSRKGGEYNFLVAQPDELKERSTATFFSKKEMALQTQPTNTERQQSSSTFTHDTSTEEVTEALFLKEKVSKQK